MATQGPWIEADRPPQPRSDEHRLVAGVQQLECSLLALDGGAGPEVDPEIDDVAQVSIEDPEGCPRYACRVVEGVQVGVVVTTGF